ncbi:MAG: ABC transporter ATP-binding protein [Deltaproteobacteria bacterium]|nr:ABC transporter ATP-binding protein [Deltaproteobacteria bacterium]
MVAAAAIAPPAPAIGAASAPVIEIEDVTRVYHLGDVDVHALRGVSLRVERGESIAIMGASGSGKSTLMNLIGCLDRPTSGTYRLAGKDVSRLSASELARVRGERIGFVFQNFNLLARTSAVENVELPLLYAGVGGHERRTRAIAALEQVGLGSRLDHTPNQLSGGQQQRVAIARALVSQPEIVLADEPTGNLDSRTSVEVMAMMQALVAKGITVVLVTHEPDIAQYAARVLTLKDGKVVSDTRHEPVRAVLEPEVAS